MARTRNKRKRIKTELRKNGSHTKFEITGKYQRSENVSRCHTIHGKFATETFGANEPIEKITQN